VDVLPLLLAIFRKNHPHVLINLRSDNSAAIERMIINDEVDIALINNVSANHLLAIEHYRREQLVAFVPRNSSLSRKQNLTWQDLSRVHIIIRRSIHGHGGSEQFIQTLTKRGIVPNIVFRCDSPEAVKAAVKKKIGVGILFKETITHELKKGELKLLKLPPEHFVGGSFIVYRKDRPLSKAAQEFRQLLRQHQHRLVERNHKVKAKG
jgi:DNA-binding transcriptional LysR family regulator